MDEREISIDPGDVNVEGSKAIISSPELVEAVEAMLEEGRGYEGETPKALRIAVRSW